MEENLTFEERWKLLLSSSVEKLKTLTDADGKDAQIRELWTDVNRFVTIMAIPKEVRSSMRKTLWKMARKSSWKQAGTIVLYLLFTFLPRRFYRNVNTQHWFKERLGRS